MITGAIPSSTTTLVVLLGASTWPMNSELSSLPSCARSAKAIRGYFLDSKGMGLPRENLLDLFNSIALPSKIFEKIQKFITERTDALAKIGTRPLDIIVYYSGHGFFTSDSRRVYCLALKGSKGSPIDEVTSISVPTLGSILHKWAGWSRRYIILDACFSAAALKDLQSPVGGMVSANLSTAIPDRGTALFSASSSYEPTRAPATEKYTLFSGAMITALRHGLTSSSPRLSLRELGDLISAELQHYKNAAHPEIHVPDQPVGDVASIPLFPNPAWSEDWAIVAPRLCVEVLECIRLGNLGEAEIISDRLEHAGNAVDEGIRLKVFYDRACIESLKAASLKTGSEAREAALNASVEYLKRWIYLGLSDNAWVHTLETPYNAIYKMSRDGDLHQVMTDRRSVVINLIPINLRDQVASEPPKGGGGGGCVPLGTFINTPTGKVKVETLREGDYILSLYLAQPRHLLRTKVVKIHTLREPYCISINDAHLFTPTQPLYKPEGGVIRAGEY